ncbi:protein-glutamate methylesterase/protein-glutamine glutaminase [Thalassotalea agariperforans]
MDKIKVLIVDDSSVIRAIVRGLLSQDESIVVVGEAENPLVARELIKKLNPDVLTLDVEMPKMDGITFLSNLMRLRPMPVVMLSTLTTKGADITLQALEIGAVDFIAKPSVESLIANKASFKDLLIDKIKHAITVNHKNYQLNQQLSKPSSELELTFEGADKNHIIAIGASTGGTEAIKSVLIQLPKNSPPIVIAQHIPPTFSARFASRLNSLCAMQVHEAKHGQKILPGHVYIAPGDRHLKVESKGDALFCVLDDSAEVNRHKPAVDVLFNSLVAIAKNVQAIVLTGMGSDGAKGLLNLQQAGARTIIQDEQSSLIWGMPGSAAKLHAYTDEFSLKDIAKNILAFAKLPQHKRAKALYVD